MKAAIIHAPLDLRIEEFDTAALGPQDVKVRIRAGGICGSDLHYYQHGGFGTVRLRQPMVLGHEIAGEVSAVGADVTRVRPGDAVAVNPSQPCSVCRFCLRGQPNHCSDMRFYGSAMRMPHVHGGFRETLVCTEAQAVPVPPGTSLHTAAFAEPLAVCLHAARQAGPLLGQRVLVTGTGPIGALVILVARHAGAREVVATDITVGILLAVGLVSLDRSGLVPQWLLKSAWLYNGGGTGARTLLGAVASSTIGVAGTVFSITIAALSLAAGQMGPRLLRNFTKDRGNQITLGAFLGTFSYALMVLRSVRTESEGAFVPHVSLSVGILLAFLCVATLVFFVGHMAGRINVDKVIELVSRDVQAAMARLTTEERQPAPLAPSFWRDAAVICDPRSGYLQELDESGLADWADANGTTLRLLVRPGDYVFPGAPIALALPAVDGIDAAIRRATALGQQRVSSADLEYAVRQLVEVAVRALSPGINDPHTAMSVLDRLAAAMCEIAPLTLPRGISMRRGRTSLEIPAVDYDGLADAMFHMIRQNAAGSAAVLIRMLDVLTAVVSCEQDTARRRALQRHADLVVGDAERGIATPADLGEIRGRHARFTAMTAHGARGLVVGRNT